MIYEILFYISLALLTAYLLCLFYVQSQRSEARCTAILQEKAAKRILDAIKKDKKIKRKELKTVLKTISTVDIYRLKIITISNPEEFIESLLDLMKDKRLIVEKQGEISVPQQS